MIVGIENPLLDISVNCDEALLQKYKLEANAAILADMLELELSRVLAFTYAYACLNASWWSLRGDREDFVQWSLKVAMIIEPHLANHYLFTGLL
jgi:streptomycin 6-kinase